MWDDGRVQPHPPCRRRRFLCGIGAMAAAYAARPLTVSASADAADGSLECDKNIRMAGEQDPTIMQPLSPGVQGARRNGFVRPALAVELDYPISAFHQGFLEAPTCFHQPFIRTYVHEVLHFWQTLSQVFIANLAVEEFLATKEFQETGAAPTAQSMIARFSKVPRGAPFSPWELSESLCRYWDIHILGPVRLLKERADEPVPDDDPTRPYHRGDFDYLMMIEDAYAAPYRWAIESWGSQSSVLLFPLAGYFAMQTPKPVEVFLATGVTLKEMAGQLRGSIHDIWRKIFAAVRKECNATAFRITGMVLTPGWDVIRRSGVKNSSLWRHYLKLADIFVGLTEEPIDFSFAVPGDPAVRGTLAQAFRPAVTLFRDGRWLSQAPLGVAALLYGKADLRDGTALADEAQQLIQNYRAMREWAALQRYR
jgi:hypothetical protein